MGLDGTHWLLLSAQYCFSQTRARSYASRNQLAVSQKEIDAGAELEWERRYLTTLGVANKRLYEFRIQTSQAAFQKAEVRCAPCVHEASTLLHVARSLPATLIACCVL